MYDEKSFQNNIYLLQFPDKEIKRILRVQKYVRTFASVGTNKWGVYWLTINASRFSFIWLLRAWLTQFTPISRIPIAVILILLIRNRHCFQPLQDFFDILEFLVSISTKNVGRIFQFIIVIFMIVIRSFSAFGFILFL